MDALRRLAPLALLALVVACGPSGNRGPLSTSGADGGTTKTCATTHSTRHQSYVPASFTPPDVSRLIVMGDSISTGTGASKTSLSYYALLDQNDDSTWPAEAATDLKSYYGHDVTVVDVAQDGATTSTLIQQEVPNLEQELPAPKGRSMVVITIGGNDLLGAMAPGGGDPTGAVLTNAIQNITATVQALQDTTKFPDGTSIYLMDVYDPSDGVGSAQGCFYNLSFPQFVTALDTWKQKYVQLGQQMRFAVIDALGAFHGHGFHYDDPSNQYYQAKDPTLWFAPDCIHPDDRGHDEIRRLFYEAVDCSYVATP